MKWLPVVRHSDSGDWRGQIFGDRRNLVTGDGAEGGEFSASAWKRSLVHSHLAQFGHNQYHRFTPCPIKAFDDSNLCSSEVRVCAR